MDVHLGVDGKYTFGGCHLIHKVILILETAPPGDDLNSALCDAAFLFKKSQGMEPCGWSQDVIDTEFTSADVSQLQRTMIAFIERGGHGTFSLGKSADPAMKPIFIFVMQREMNGDPSELYQAMIALEDIGERPFQERHGKGVLDVAENRESARKYLSSIGIPN